jgi:lipopolysaccharide export system protein LptC
LGAGLMKPFNFKEGPVKIRQKFQFPLTGHKLGLLTLFIFLGSCAGEELTPEDFEPYVGPVSIIENLALTYSDSARILIRMNAPVQREFLNYDREFPEGVELVFFNHEGIPESTLNANYAKVDGNTGIYLVRGNVVIVNLIEKRKLNTEELYWNPKTKKIYTEKNVIIDQYGKRLMGKGLEAEQDFSSYEIKDLKGIIPLKESDEKSF